MLKRPLRTFIYLRSAILDVYCGLCLSIRASRVGHYCRCRSNALGAPIFGSENAEGLRWRSAGSRYRVVLSERSRRKRDGLAGSGRSRCVEGCADGRGQFDRPERLAEQGGYADRRFQRFGVDTRPVLRTPDSFCNVSHTGRISFSLARTSEAIVVRDSAIVISDVSIA